MSLLRLVYGLHYMPYHALTLINAHSKAYFAHFGCGSRTRRECEALSSLYSSRFAHVYYVKFMRVCCIWTLCVARSGDALNDALMGRHTPHPARARAISLKPTIDSCVLFRFYA